MTSCDCCDVTTSTTDVIRELCGKACKQSCVTISSTEDCPRPERSYRRSFDPGLPGFTSIITPLSNLVPSSSGCTGCVEFLMRRKNKTVTLQWEPFSGNLAASGIAYLTVVQSFCNTPPYPIAVPIYLIYKGVGRNTHLTINPAATSGNIRFYLNTDGSTTDTTIGDNVVVAGGSATWIVD